MILYKYSFPASGNVNAPPTFSTTALENRLKDSPDCLMTYCMFPSDSDILDHVSYDFKYDKIIAINLHTFTQLYEGMEDDLKACVEENLKALAEEAKEKGWTNAGIKIEGEVQAMGQEGEIPDTLYRLSQRKNLESILEKGLIPQQGKRGYKSYEDYVYLIERSDIVPWLAVLPHLDDPVILEVKTKGVEGIEPGRHFTDRDFTKPNGYGEYRTKNIVPAANIKEMNLTNEVKYELIDAVKQYTEKADSYEERVEITVCVNRLMNMGVFRENTKAVEDRMRIEENNLMKTKNGREVSMKGIGTFLRDTQREGQYDSFSNLSNRELCESIRTHFELHPTMPGEKALKDRANQILNTAEIMSGSHRGQIMTNIVDQYIRNDRDFLMRGLADTRIRQTSFEGLVIPTELTCEQVDRVASKLKADGTPAEIIDIKKVDVELEKKNNTVLVMAETNSKGRIQIGTLPENFVKNNPMNVDICEAELQIVDYSNGKMKNISSKIVINTDVMSGDIVSLDEDMIGTLDNKQDLQQ